MQPMFLMNFDAESIFVEVVAEVVVVVEVVFEF